MRIINILICSLMIVQNGIGQTREAGPWWPHPLWGADDQAGASNWITPEKILQAVSLVTQGKYYELGQVYEPSMPLIGSRSYKMTIPSFPTYGPNGTENIVFNDEFLCTEIGQVGTQFDGPGHVGKQMKLEDGRVTEVFYNGFTSNEMRHPYGLQKLGIENVKPYLTRGVLIDLAAVQNDSSVAPNYEATLEDVRSALSRQGMNESALQPGDALLFNFGWWRHWPDHKVLDEPPHLSREVVDWIISKQPSMVGSDATLDGPVPNVHLELTLKNGIWNLEWMRFKELLIDQVFEFMFVYTPLRLKGATGSPGRPIAVR